MMLAHKLREDRSVTLPAQIQKREGAYVSTHSEIVAEMELEPTLY